MFSTDIKKQIEFSGKKIVLIGKNIQKKTYLINQFSIQLEFPPYFGKNFDALYDCLMDLSWVKEKEISIVHEDIPLDGDKNEQKKYIELLSDILDSWSQSDIHKVDILFPETTKLEIERLISWI